MKLSNVIGNPFISCLPFCIQNDQGTIVLGSCLYMHVQLKRLSSTSRYDLGRRAMCQHAWTRQPKHTLQMSDDNAVATLVFVVELSNMIGKPVTSCLIFCIKNDPGTIVHGSY